MLSFTLDTGQSERFLNKLARTSSNFSSFFNEVERYLQRQIKEQFASEGKEITGQWAALQASTIADRLRQGFAASPILQRTGKLKRSYITKEKTRDKLVIGSTVNYHQYHQLGGKKLPQRQILGFSNKMQKEIADNFAQYITNQLRRG